MRTRGAKMQISSSSARSILDSVATRIDEARDITRYLANLLIFLGLLGTFYGLATTVPAVVETIRSLAPHEGEGGIEVFDRLMTGLEEQLGGMGMAFASSLLGLAGSLVVGLLELFASHGQNRFYRELEEWLSTITRLGFASGDGEGSARSAARSSPCWNTWPNRWRRCRRSSRNPMSAGRASTSGSAHWPTAVERLTAKLEAETSATAALKRMAEGQERLVEVLEDGARAGGAHVDAESRMRLRSIDVQLLRILEEMSAGRQESLGRSARTIWRALTSAIRQLGRAGRRRAGPRQGLSADGPVSGAPTQRMSGTIWPGFVDAMTALLLVLMFVLTIFMIVQFVLRETISGQENELDAARRAEVNALAQALGLEQSRAAELEDQVAALDANAGERPRQADGAGGADRVAARRADRGAGCELAQSAPGSPVSRRRSPPSGRSRRRAAPRVPR